MKEKHITCKHIGCNAVVPSETHNMTVKIDETKMFWENKWIFLRSPPGGWICPKHANTWIQYCEELREYKLKQQRDKASAKRKFLFAFNAKWEQENPLPLRPDEIKILKEETNGS